MKHYAVDLQCRWCGHRFTVCVHSVKLVASGKTFTVLCPENRSKVQVPTAALSAVESCPAGAIVVRGEWGRTRY